MGSGPAGIEVVGLLGMQVAVEPEVIESVEPALARSRPVSESRRPADVRDPPVPMCGDVLGGGANARCGRRRRPRPARRRRPTSARTSRTGRRARGGRRPGRRWHGCWPARTRPRPWWPGGRGRPRSRPVSSTAWQRMRWEPGRARGLGERVQELVEQQRRAVVAGRAPPSPRSAASAGCAGRGRSGWGGSRARGPRPGSARGWRARPGRGCSARWTPTAAETPTCRATSPSVTWPWGAGRSCGATCCLALKSRTVKESTQTATSPRQDPRCSRCCTTSSRAWPRPACYLAAADGQVRPGRCERLVRRRQRASSTRSRSPSTARSSTWCGRPPSARTRQEFSYVARGLGDPLPDPTVRLDRFRTVSGDRGRGAGRRRLGCPGAGRRRACG